jgi:hypothetical protein
MKILIINFNLKGLEVDAFKAQAHIDAMDFRGVEGLISKYFIGDENENVYGGVYIFLKMKRVLRNIKRVQYLNFYQLMNSLIILQLRNTV